MDSNQTQRVYYLAALAAVRSGTADEALQYVQKGQAAAARLGDREMHERLRNLEGEAFAALNQPLSALEVHRECLRSIEAGAVRDTNLKFRAYANVAADYWALHDTERALSTYRSALALADEVNNIERQAQIYKDLASSYSEMHDYYL